VGAYIVRRLLISVPVLFGITVLGFVLLKNVPGDPLLAQMDPERLASLNPEALAAERHRLGLDQPIFVQYVAWLFNVLHGDFGFSILTRRDILAEEIGPRIPQTLFLMLTSFGIAILVGIPIGVISAVRQYSKADYALNAGAMFAASTPVFVLGLLGIYIFAVRFHWLPTGGLHTIGHTDIGDAFVHLILPASVLATVNAAPLVRYTRASMLDVLTSDYITTARSKGLAPSAVIVRHALRNGLIPIITLIALLIPESVAGAVITEQVFNWNGMGQLAVYAANNRDPSVMMGIILLVGTLVLAGNLVADIAYAYTDPRIRYGRPR
jgi:peptide/nickel transport system permease protein